MINWPFFSQGEPLSASKFRRLVQCCRELERLAESCKVQPGVGYCFSRGPGGTTLAINSKGRQRGVKNGEPFTLKRLEGKNGEYKAYFWPGMVFDVHPGGVRRIKPEVDGSKMDEKEPSPFLSVQDGDKVFLYLERGAEQHDCITYAEVTVDEVGLERSVRIFMGEFKAEVDEDGEETLKYKEAWSGDVCYAQSSLNEGWRVVVDTDEEGAPDMAYVRMGDVYIAGQLAKRGGGGWEVSPKEEGEIWLKVTCGGDGVIKDVEITNEKGTPKPLKYIRDTGDDEDGDEEFTYCFLLAKVEKVAEPLREDGNLPNLVVVRQYMLGAAHCDVAPDALVIKAGKGIEIKEENDGGKKEVSALIEDAKEPSSNDCSLIYEEEDEEGGNGEDEEGNKGKPYKIKLLCSSDESVLIKDENGRIYLSAAGKMPKAGDGLEYETQQNGEGVEEETDTLRIRIDSSVDSSGGENGKWPVNLSVSPAGLKGELDLTVDTQKHDVGGGYKVALSTATKGTLALDVTSGEPEEPLSFRAPLRQNGKYVVLDYDQSWCDPVNGISVHLFDQGGTLAVELHAETEPDGTDSLISDSWTALACDSDHALRLNRDENGRIYIQQGEWIVTSGIYSPMN